MPTSSWTVPHSPKDFPFVNHCLDLVTNRNHSQRLYPTKGTLFNVTTETSVSERNKCFQQPSDAGQTLLAKMDNIRLGPRLNIIKVPPKQYESLCVDAGLKAVLPKDHKAFTWPASSCKGFGTMRGDNICTNMVDVEPERTTKPCVTKQGGFGVPLGDHALTGWHLAFRTKRTHDPPLSHLAVVCN
jgi:hypothetical protein